MIQLSSLPSGHHAHSTVFQQIKTWFNNRCRGADSMKQGRGDLKLDIGTKRKLAPVQAFCTYAWASLQPIVLARWEAQKKSATFDDEDDPPEDVDATSSTGAHIPLSFKLKIAKEVFDELPIERKKEIDRRRTEDQKKLYRTIPEIPDDQERVAKLQIHQRFHSLDRCAANSSNPFGYSGTNRSPLNPYAVSSRTMKTRQGASHTYSSLRWILKTEPRRFRSMCFGSTACTAD